MICRYSKSLVYPSWCFCINEDVTRSNKADYDRRTALLRDMIFERYPLWITFPLEERHRLREEMKKEIGGRW